MNTAQIEQLIIQKSKGLPADLLQEVLDFIEFLRSKRTVVTTNSMHTTLSEVDFLELNHLEEEFTDYKKIHPQE